MVAEAALGVVVLAVHVGGDRAADGHLPGAGQHRNPQPERQQRLHQGVDADAGLHAHRRRVALGVDLQDLVETGQVQGGAAGVLGGVAVASGRARGGPPTTAGVPQGGDGPGDRCRSGRGGTRLPAARPQPCSSTSCCGTWSWLSTTGEGWIRVAVARPAAHANTAIEMAANQITPNPCSTRSCSTTSSGSPACPASTSRAYCSMPRVNGAIEIAVHGTPRGRLPRFSKAHRL